MQDLGLSDRDVLEGVRAEDAARCDIVIAEVNAEFTVKGLQPGIALLSCR